MPDGNETISSHLGLEPEGLGDSRWAAFPRRASHGIGEFGQAQKGEVEWSGVERKWQAWTRYMYTSNCVCMGFGVGWAWARMVFYVWDVGCRCVGKRRVDGTSTGSPGQAVMGQLGPGAALAMPLAAMYVLCTTQTTMCCVRHEHDAEGEKKCKNPTGKRSGWLAGND